MFDKEGTSGETVTMKLGSAQVCANQSDQPRLMNITWRVLLTLMLVLF